VGHRDHGPEGAVKKRLPWSVASGRPGWIREEKVIILSVGGPTDRCFIILSWAAANYERNGDVELGMNCYRPEKLDFSVRASLVIPESSVGFQL
jgi:hypothetical protein